MKRISAILLALVLCICVLPICTFATEDTITVRVEIDTDTAPNAWAWGVYGNAFEAERWPGKAMTKVGDYWEIQVPVGTTGFIVNNGSAQTGDITIAGDVDALIKVSSDFSSFEVLEGGTSDGGEPVEPGELTGMALVGEGDDELGWSPEDASMDMTLSTEGVYTKDISLYKGTAIMFKFCGNDSWDAGYNYGLAADGSITAGTATELMQGNDSKNIGYTATQDCTLTITLDMTGNAPKVTVTETAAELGGQPPVVTPPENNAGELTSMALVGEGHDELKWEPDNAACEMTLSKDGVYTKVLSLTANTTITFKFCGNDSWDAGYNYGLAADGSITAGTATELMQGNDSKNIVYTATADGNVTITLDTNGTPTVTITAGGEVTPPSQGENPEVTTPETTKPDATKPAGGSEDNGISRKTRALIILGTALLAIVAVAFVLSLPKKIQ